MAILYISDLMRAMQRLLSRYIDAIFHFLRMFRFFEICSPNCTKTLMFSHCTLSQVVMMGDRGVGKTRWDLFGILFVYLQPSKWSLAYECFSVVIRCVSDTFSGSSQPTIGAAFSSKDIQVTGEAKPIRLHIWDTAGKIVGVVIWGWSPWTVGEEAYRAMTKSFFRGAAAGAKNVRLASSKSYLVAAVLVFDVTDRASFDHLAGWIRDFQVRFRQLCCAVDLLDNRIVHNELCAGAVSRCTAGTRRE